jgi:hypothetical protein
MRKSALITLTTILALATPAVAKDKTRQLTAKQYDAFVGEGPSAVMFYSRWDKGYKDYRRLFEKACETHSQLRCGVVDIDEQSEAGMKAKALLDTPNTVFYNGGKEVGKLSKVQPKEQLDAKIAELYPAQ